MPIKFSRPSAQALDSLLEKATTESVTYPEVGCTAGPDLPDGYHHDRFSVSLGHDDPAFRRGQEALRTWQGHRSY